MSFSKYLGSFLLLLHQAFCCCPTTLAQPWISIPPSPSPAPLPSSPPKQPVLLDQEVTAINALLRLSRIPAPNIDLWFSSTDCGSQQFRNSITCNCSSTACRVIEIDFSSQILTGKIPNEIGVFPELKSLDLSSNRLYGPIPPSIVNLSQLSYLDLRDNNLEGSLNLISEMKSLRSLYLWKNQFSDTIPPKFGSLPSLEYLSISNNLLSGDIPAQLGNISSLTALFCYDNLLTGQLPPELGNLSSNLQLMVLSNNEFYGSLPSELGKLEQMVVFDIQGCSISGPIPDFIGNWQRLRKLMLVGNNFEGSLPSNISALTSLSYLATNDLPGTPGGSLFPEISNAIFLRVLTLRHCSLTDVIPDYIWRLRYLHYLDLSFNRLTGGIPVNVSQPELQHIFLRGNKLIGSLPGWMLNSSKFVDVSGNLFSNRTLSGNIVSNRTNVFECCSNGMWEEADNYCANGTLRYDHLYINCGGNQTTINGSQYEADVNPYGASTFFLSKNRAWAYSSMGIFMDSKGKQPYLALETCNISAEDAPLYMTARASPISLKYYGFCLKDGDYIVRLHFAEIGWNAAKVKDSGMKRRRVFDVEIQGQKVLTDFNIEEAASGIGKDVTMNFTIPVNKSRLEIHLYWSGKGSTTYPSTYYGPLISAISVSPVPKDHRKLPPGVISAIAGSVLVFAFMILILCRKLGWVGGKRQDGVEVFPGGIFKSEDIKAATNNFSPNNLIGDGGFGAVYKGKLPDEREIAVKQLSSKSKQGAHEFITEMGTIFTLNHPNLVKLHGGCVAERQLLLVYEYMENSSLDRTLFGPKEAKEKLDWKTRVKICLDVAKGLAFLHDCDLKIIHGDIKPTNILLDKDFNAKISDFGFARPDQRRSTQKIAQPKEGESKRVNTRLKGTQEYIAPELRKNEDSPKVDVYSFGILTLEIISGQRSSKANPRGATIYLLQRAYAHMQEGNLLGLLDPSLESNYNQKEAKVIICLAMNCISHDPDQRPTMSEVVKVLEGKKKIENVSVPVPVEDLLKGKDTGASLESIRSTSTSFKGASDPSKEIEDSSTSTHHAAQS